MESSWEMNYKPNLYKFQFHQKVVCNKGERCSYLLGKNISHRIAFHRSSGIAYHLHFCLSSCAGLSGHDWPGQPEPLEQGLWFTTEPLWYGKTGLDHGFSTDILDQIILCCGMGLTSIWGIFSSICGFCSTCELWYPQMFPDTVRYSLCGKIALHWEPLVQTDLKF